MDSLSLEGEFQTSALIVRIDWFRFYVDNGAMLDSSFLRYFDEPNT